MSDLEAYRQQIDAIDRELVRLFEARMATAEKIADHKKAHGLPIYQKEREEQVLKKVSAYGQHPENADALKAFFQHLMDLSKGLQSRKNRIPQAQTHLQTSQSVVGGSTLAQPKIGYYGAEGSFSEEASLAYFGQTTDPQNYPEFEGVFQAIQQGEIRYGVLPIENSSTGAITKVYDLLQQYNFFIVGEVYLRVDQHLVGIPGTSLHQIREVYSHPQGFEQSSQYLRDYPHWRLIPHQSTAASAKFVSEQGDASKAAISSLRAADCYHLDILQSYINNQEENTTRFIILAKELEVNERCDKVGIVFSVDDQAGTLYNLLQLFAENHINLIKIESRPTKDVNWHYYLYLDFDGNIQQPQVQKALQLVEERCPYFKVLGSFRSASKATGIQT